MNGRKHYVRVKAQKKAMHFLLCGCVGVEGQPICPLNPRSRAALSLSGSMPLYLQLQAQIIIAVNRSLNLKQGRHDLKSPEEQLCPHVQC